MSKITIHTLNIDNKDLNCYDLSKIKNLSINGSSYTLIPATAPNVNITALDLSDTHVNRPDEDTLDMYSAIPSTYNALSPNTCNGLSYLSPRSPSKLYYAANYLAKEEKRDLEKMMVREREMMVTERNRREAHIFVPKIEAIFANEEKGTLVIKWKTGEETKVQTQKGDQFDVWVGVQAAITKYALGNNYNAGTVLEKYVDSVKLTSKKEK